MSLQHVRPLLSAYVDGEATAAERRQVEEHLVRCADCAQVLAEYRSIGSNVRAMPRPVPPPTLHRDVWTAIEASRGRSVWGTNLSGLLRWGAVGATALAAVVIAFLIVRPNGTAGSVAMTRPVDKQSNVGINAPVIIHFDPPVTENALAQVLVSKNVDEKLVYEHWVITGTDIEVEPVATDPNMAGQWPAMTTIAISVTGPVYLAKDNQVVIKGGEAKQFTFTTGTKLDPTDTPSPVPTDTPTPVPPTETPVPPTAEVPPTETPFVSPQDTPTAQVPPTQVQPPPGIVTETPVPGEPTKQPTQPVPPTVTTPPEPPTKQPTPPALSSATPAPPEPTTPPSVTPGLPTQTPVLPTSTPLPTNTPLPPTSTPLPTTPPTATPVLPSPQITVTVDSSPLPNPPPTQTPPGSGVQRTPTLVPLSGTPRVPTSTPAATASVVAGCPIPPLHGFGQVYNDPGHAALRQALGCPTVAESAFTYAAEQNFEHGYMFWDGDGKKVYVFSTTASTWRSYADTWVDGEPPPVVLTPPSGYYQPVRGFGKVWVDYPEVRAMLGWATGQERGGAAAWQPFAHGAMLWTDSHIIRVLYATGGWELYYDTYTGP